MQSMSLSRITRMSLLRARRRMRQWLRLQYEALSRAKALSWQRFYLARYRFQVWRLRHGEIAGTILLVLLMAVSALGIPALQEHLEPLLAEGSQLQMLRTLFQTLGGALLGATAIVTSLVLFSMQVNVERMPHGLFQRLSTDRLLLSAFAAAFLLAVIVAGLSLIPDSENIGIAIFVASWSIALILVLFLTGYRRALVLINPTRQLGLVIDSTCRDFRAWVRSAKRAAPLLTDPSPGPSEYEEPFASQHDVARAVYFQANSHWTNGAKQAVRYAVSFARRYAEQGDHEVSAAAIRAVVAINAAYVEAKGKTFFANQLLFDNPYTTDGFINDTLEHLRQTARIGISRGDEQQIEQTLKAFAALVSVYSGIDYSIPHATKTHAHLAAGYLSQEVERTVPHNMADVLMTGAQLMGQCAGVLLIVEGPIAIQTLVEKLGALACCGVVKEDYRPVTSACVEQIAGLSFDLLRTRSHDVRFLAKEIRGTMSLLVKVFLTTPGTPLMSTHSLYLGPYYSATNSQALCERLAGLVNAISDANENDENAQQAIHSIEQWADGIYETEKELLLEAINRRSHFTFDMIHWISSLTSMLLAVSNAPACNRVLQDKLRNHALWLISVFSFMPDEPDAITFIENFQMTETLFDAALDAHQRDCKNIALKITDLLASWMFKAGPHRSGWAILERSIYGLAVLALLAESDGAIPKLKARIVKGLRNGGLPDPEERDHAALNVRGRARNLFRPGRWSSSIERELATADRAKLKPLLEELADLISPRTAGQAAAEHFF